MDLRTVAALAALTTLAACSDAPASADSRTAEETAAFIVLGFDNAGDFDTGRRGKVTITKEQGPPLVLTMTEGADANKSLKFAITKTDNCNYALGFEMPGMPSAKVTLDFTNLTSAKMLTESEVWLDGASVRCAVGGSIPAELCREFDRGTFPFRFGPLDPQKMENKAAHQARLNEAVKFLRENVCVAKQG